MKQKQINNFDFVGAGTPCLTTTYGYTGPSDITNKIEKYCGGTTEENDLYWNPILGIRGRDKIIIPD